MMNKNGKILTGFRDRDGYRCIHLYHKGKKETLKVHRLVMQAFVGESILDVNHKNGIKDDNRPENLEYCTRSENEKHAYRVLEKKASYNLGKKCIERAIKQLDLKGKFIKMWKSQKEAGRKLTINQSHISGCCNGLRQTTGGYKWQFA